MRLQPVFQPIFDLERGLACGFEMLARFDSDRQAAPPEWFTEADACGLGSELEALVVSVGLDARDALPPDCFLTINLSPGALLTDEVQAELFGSRLLDRHVVEVTEREPVADYPELLAVLDRLRVRHGMLAVDDAGAGYASLRRARVCGTRSSASACRSPRASVSRVPPPASSCPGRGVRTPPPRPRSSIAPSSRSPNPTSRASSPTWPRPTASPSSSTFAAVRWRC